MRSRRVAATIALTNEGAIMTHTRRTSLLASLSLVILVALTVAACGGGGANASSTTAATSSGRPPTVRVENSALGEILVDTQGRTLYPFKADSHGVSACDGACAAAWPPLLAHGNPRVAGGASASLLSTIERTGGAGQLAYNGHPLYLYAGDQKPGDVNGQGVTAFGAPWYALSPTGSQVTTSP
jgi:predicted lipoprotein with Yx(FWY)xxD motif